MRIPLRLEVERMRPKTSTDLWEVYSLLGRFFPLHSSSEQFLSFTTNKFLKGYEDRDRFVILQKLGIDQKTIKKSINRRSANRLLLAACHCVYPYRICLQDVS